jgi:hypothetical protein
MTICRLLLALSLFAGLLSRVAIAADEQQFRLATFSSDVTIPLGHRCMGILPTKAQAIDDPLEAQGFVLLGGEKPVVVLALDWCEVRNGAYDQWREALAEAAGTTRERVLLSSLHQHDAPVTDNEAQDYLDRVGMEQELFDREFQNECIARCCEALKESLEEARPVTHIGTGQARVEKVASSRRVVNADGTIHYDRGSASGGNAVLAAADEGPIDPYLKTLSFWNGDEPLLALHAYAIHPMSYYGKGGVSADFVGRARRLRQREQPGVAQIYVSGCSGDVTAGKYNDGSADMRPVLADRLLQGMRQAWENTERRPIGKLSFRTAQLQLPFHEGEEFQRDALTKTLHDGNAREGDRILAAMSLSSLDRIDRGQPIDVPCLELDGAKILLLPGESFVGYQLQAQQMDPESFVVTIGYSECWPGYVPSAAAFEEGFGHSWRWVSAGAPKQMEAAMREALQAPAE